MNTDTKSLPGALVNQSGKSVTPTKKPAVGRMSKGAHTAKATGAPRRPLRSSGTASVTGKLVCRYCGSDDLAPSFKKRRDARCRACFKKRYGPAPRDKSAVRRRKAKAAK